MDLTQACYLMADKLIALRRDSHRYPELGWLEFRTSAIVASTLSWLGYKVLLGDEVINREGTMGFPDADEIDRGATHEPFRL